MVLKVFTIYDSKVQAYKQPVFMRNSGEAIRAMQEILTDPQHNFTKFCEDYTLFELGEYDDENASFNLHLTPKSVAKLNELKKPVETSKPTLLEKAAF